MHDVWPTCSRPSTPARCPWWPACTARRLAAGMGLCAVADIVLADADTAFGFTETRLGILPAVISPFVLSGASARGTRARSSRPASDSAPIGRWTIGLVHEVLPDEAALDARLTAAARRAACRGTRCRRAAKAIIRDQRGLDAERRRGLTITAIARQRTSAEGQEGLTAFLEKRPPAWRRERGS